MPPGLSGLKYIPYKESLKMLKIYDMKRRLLRGDLILVSKIMRGMTRFDFNKFFEENTGERTRGHKKKLKVTVKRARHKPRAMTFSRCTIQHWNSLPQDVIQAETVDGFKNRLDQHWEMTIEALRSHQTMAMTPWLMWTVDTK